MLNDVLSVYGAGGKAIVFTKTKVGADEVAAAVSQAQVGWGGLGWLSGMWWIRGETWR